MPPQRKSALLISCLGLGLFWVISLFHFLRCCEIIMSLSANRQNCDLYDVNCNWWTRAEIKALNLIKISALCIYFFYSVKIIYLNGNLHHSIKSLMHAYKYAIIIAYVHSCMLYMYMYMLINVICNWVVYFAWELCRLLQLK